MTNETQFFRKIYLSHFIWNGTKGLRKGYVSKFFFSFFDYRISLYLRRFCVSRSLIYTDKKWFWRLNKTATYWPPALLAIAALLSHPAGLLNRGAWGPCSLLGLVLTASNCKNWLQTSWTSCRTGLYHCLTPTCFLWASHLHRIQPIHGQGDTLISSTGCTCFLIDGWVNMLHTGYLTKSKEYSLLFYYSITDERMNGFLSFPDY